MTPRKPPGLAEPRTRNPIDASDWLVIVFLAAIAVILVCYHVVPG